METPELIHLINESEPFTAMWDGHEYTLTSEPLEVEKGIAEHWINRHPEAQLRIEEIEQGELESRTPINPLEANNRGESFASLKKPRGKREKEA